MNNKFLVLALSLMVMAGLHLQSIKFQANNSALLGMYRVSRSVMCEKYSFPLIFFQDVSDNPTHKSFTLGVDFSEETEILYDSLFTPRPWAFPSYDSNINMNL